MISQKRVDIQAYIFKIIFTQTLDFANSAHITDLPTNKLRLSLLANSE